MNLLMNEWEDENDLFRLRFNLILLLFAWKCIQHLRFPVAHNITPNGISVSDQHPAFWVFKISSFSMLHYNRCMAKHILWFWNQNTRKLYYRKFIVRWSTVNSLLGVCLFFFLLWKRLYKILLFFYWSSHLVLDGFPFARSINQDRQESLSVYYLK